MKKMKVVNTLRSMTAILLAVVMSLCSVIYAGASGETPLEVTSNLSDLDEWAVSEGGSGTIVENPTNTGDDVAKIAANSTATLTFPATYTGNTLVSADVYFTATEGNVLVSLKNDSGASVVDIPINIAEQIAAGTIKAGTWNKVRALVSTNGKLCRIYAGEHFLGETPVSNVSVNVKSVSFGGNVEFYINDVTADKYSSPASADFIKPIYTSNFNGDIGSDANNSDGWSYVSSRNDKITYKIAEDPASSGSHSVIKAENSAGSNTASVSNLTKSIDISGNNAVIAAKFYAPGSVDDSTNAYEFNFSATTDAGSISLANSYYSASSQKCIFSLDPPDVGIKYTQQYTTDTWHEVKAVIDFQLQSYDIYLDGIKVNTAPCVLNTSSKVSKITALNFGISRKATGVAYMKDVSISTVDTVKTPASAGETTTIYSQNFESLTSDSDVAGYDKFENTNSKSKEAKFTAKTISFGTEESKVGQLFDPNYRSTQTTLKRLTDDGSNDIAAKDYANNEKYEESFSTDISSFTETIKANGNITLKFKYYNAKNAVTVKDDSQTPADMLYIGFSGGNDPRIGSAKSDTNDTYISIRNQTMQIYDYKDTSYASRLSAAYAAVQQWQNVEITLSKKSDAKTYAILKAGNETSPERELNGFYDYNRLVLRLDQAIGGKFYLDDIQVTTTAADTPAVEYTQDELMSLDNATLENIYTNPIGDSDVKDVKEAAAAFEITMPIDITNGIALDSFGANETRVTWTSSNTDVISAMGVVHPKVGQSQEVTLTATISKGNASTTKEFKVTVPAVNEYDIKGIQVTGSDGITDSLLVAGKKITAVNIKRYADTGATVQVVCALYDKAGSLASAVINDVNTNDIVQYEQKTINLTKTLEIPDAATADSGYRAYVFLLDDFTNIKPLAEAKNYGVQKTDPTVFICSDSTACEYVSDTHAPRTGWGQKLGALLDGATVNNIAVSGMSSRSFFFDENAAGDKGRANTLNTSLSEGDIVLVQFGHNDEEASLSAKRTVNVNSDGTVDTTKSNSYTAYLQMIVDMAAAKNASVVFVTSPSKLNGGPSAAPSLMKSLAESIALPVVDLNSASSSVYSKLREESKEPKYYFMYWTSDTKDAFITAHGPLGTYYSSKESNTDGTHFNAEGADMIAHLFAGCVDKTNIMSRYLKTGSGKTVDETVAAYPQN